MKSDQITNAERVEVLKNDRLLRRAQTEASGGGGRFAAFNQSSVTGATPAIEYPRLPSGPWSAQPQPGPEAPLGYSVAALERTGEADETGCGEPLAEDAAATSSSAVEAPAPDLNQPTNQADGGE